MSDSIRVLVVDDEKPARQRLIALLGRHPAVDIVAACADGVETLDALASAARGGAPIDIVFLDVQMPEMDGFSVLESLSAATIEHMPVIVFVTAHDEYALRAFDARAVDYLLKPYSDERFDLALTRAIRLARNETSAALLGEIRALLDQVVGVSRAPGAEPTTRNYPDRLPVKDRGRIHLIEVSQIRWISADGVYVRIHTGTRTYLHREILGRLEATLDPRTFVRVHRSHIVNFDCVHELAYDDHGDYIVRLDDATTLRISRSYRARLEARLHGPP
jgi:two-component system, LytTR family, response regulator